MIKTVETSEQNREGKCGLCCYGGNEHCDSHKCFPEERKDKKDVYFERTAAGKAQ